MRKYLVFTGLATVIMVVWIVSYLTTYSAGAASANSGPWFADTEVAKNGWSQFQAAGCAQCHSILGQQGQSTGPDLTEVGKRWQADQLKQLIRNPRGFFPNTIMPAHGNLSDAQLDTITKYLETLK